MQRLFFNCGFAPPCTSPAQVLTCLPPHECFCPTPPRIARRRLAAVLARRTRSPDPTALCARQKPAYPYRCGHRRHGSRNQPALPGTQPGSGLEKIPVARPFNSQTVYCGYGCAPRDTCANACRTGRNVTVARREKHGGRGIGQRRRGQKHHRSQSGAGAGVRRCARRPAGCRHLWPQRAHADGPARTRTRSD